MNRKIQILFLYLSLFCSAAFAQQDLNIYQIFKNPEKYAGKTDEVKIKGKALKPYNLSFFHSLSLKGSRETADIMEALARKDSDMAESVKEVKRGDRTVGLYCQFHFVNGENRFVLYRRSNDNDALLVYVEGPTTLDDIVKISFK